MTLVNELGNLSLAHYGVGQVESAILPLDRTILL